MELVADGEAKIEGSGLFTRESELEFDYLERYDDPVQMLVNRGGLGGCSVPADLEARILEAKGRSTSGSTSPAPFRALPK